MFHYDCTERKIEIIHNNSDMKKHNFLFASTACVLVVLVPFFASAHERRVYQIGTKDYTFIVGFLNEPVSVDDKSGVELSVMLGNGAPTMGPDGDMDGPPAATKPAEGLDKNLKVEVSAGSEKRVFSLTSIRGMPGHYRTLFYPSVATTYIFRIFGAIDTTPIDLSFSCNASGQAPADDSSMTKISEGVMQKLKSGAFGCPGSKADQVFPAQNVTLASVDQKVQEASTAVAASDTKGMTGIVLGALGLIAGVGAWIRRGKNTA